MLKVNTPFYQILTLDFFHIHEEWTWMKGCCLYVGRKGERSKELKQLCYRSVRFIFTGGHISLAVAFRGPNVILGLYKCNYSLTRGKELGTAAG